MVGDLRAVRSSSCVKQSFFFFVFRVGTFFFLTHSPRNLGCLVYGWLINLDLPENLFEVVGWLLWPGRCAGYYDSTASSSSSRWEVPQALIYFARNVIAERTGVSPYSKTSASLLVCF